jgi:hypothetical protein
VAPQELLALVDDPWGAPSCATQQHKKGNGKVWQGDNYVSEDTFGDVLGKKRNIFLRFRFQIVRGFPIDKRKLKEDILRQGIINCFFRTNEWWDTLILSWAHCKTGGSRATLQRAQARG